MLTEREQSGRPFEAIRPYLEQVDQEIRDQAEAFDVSVRGYLEYLFDASGKHIRPALALSVGGAISGKPNDRHVRLGVIVELIHMATLVHDDIMDGAKLRRNLPTAWAKWGNSLSVLLGDSMFAHALSLSTEFDDTRFCRVISKASTELCTGEILQTQRRFDLSLTKDEYFRIIAMKTGALFACSTQLAASLSGGDEDLCDRMHDYGMKLGTCYQIFDDCLDLVGKEDQAGKTLGTDLSKGKLTLPVLNLLEEATSEQKDKLNRLLIEGEPLDLSILAGIADYEGAIDRAVGTGCELLEEARGQLVGLPDNPFTDGLYQAVSFVEGLLEKCR